MFYVKFEYLNVFFVSLPGDVASSADFPGSQQHAKGIWEVAKASSSAFSESAKHRALLKGTLGASLNFHELGTGLCTVQ